MTLLTSCWSKCIGGQQASLHIQWRPNMELLMIIHPLFCSFEQTIFTLPAFACTITFITPALVLFLQKSPLSVTVQLNCYTGLKISTFEWNRLVGKAKHVKAKPLTAYEPNSTTILASTLHALHFPLLSKGRSSFEFGATVASLTD